MRAYFMRGRLLLLLATSCAAAVSTGNNVLDVAELISNELRLAGRHLSPLTPMATATAARCGPPEHPRPCRCCRAFLDPAVVRG
eukprot:COSAG05_NODE_3243_length_2213_cov_67.515571_2_plen_84_part_00